MSSSAVADDRFESGSGVRAAIERAAHLLPAQGPISVFIHHNTLHAFEGHPFEEAVELGARRFGCEPYLAESRYREELAHGRISMADLEAVLEAELGSSGSELVVEHLSRSELWRRIAVHGAQDARGPALEWLVSESDALERLRDDLPSDAREVLRGVAGPDRRAEAALVRDMWRACRDLVSRAPCTPAARPSAPVRHRDYVLALCGVDVDEWIHPLLIRVTSAFLDQGYASWAMQDREQGLYRCFVDLYSSRLARLCRPFGRSLVRVLSDESARRPTVLSSIEHSLNALAVPVDEWDAFLLEESLALRGWAGMVRQFEERPDRVPVISVPARLADLLAVRLLVTRAALAHAAEHMSMAVDLIALRAMLREQRAERSEVSASDRAWALFQIAQLCGLDGAAIDALSERDASRIEEELHRFDGIARRRVLHLAYERHLRHRFYDAMAQHQVEPVRESPAFQAIFCIDEREESLRRHLEEVDPEVETFGVAGFFGVAMYYRGATDAHPKALCPVSVRPQHYVSEASDEPASFVDRGRRAWRRLGALADKNVQVGSRHVGRGAVITAALGALWLVPLVFWVLFPWSRRALTHLRARFHGEPGARLRLDRREEPPPVGTFSGFSKEEMADIVRQQLAPLGATGRLAPLVVVLGHGSSSLNNPQESAHDCGACGGGRGGPNARAFAQMANDPAVRARLAETGMSVPAATWFVGGMRNTASNDIELYDEDRVPGPLRPLLERAKVSLDKARAREAHERCRRFDAAPLWLPSAAALYHVQARSADLAQPRPEYGHASNALCVVGRRARTRGLFLDRRAFLVSYDPSSDDDGSILSQLLAAVVPVVAGISLEYFFGYVDPTGYGCGTKLPHNVTALVGVMDGAKSDLRTGLPWQMLEIHEPVRLAIAVEAAPERVVRVIAGNPALERLVHHRWIFVAAIDPDSGELHEIEAAGARAYRPERPLESMAGPSRAHYGGRRGHLSFAEIEMHDPARAA